MTYSIYFRMNEEEQKYKITGDDKYTYPNFIRTKLRPTFGGTENKCNVQIGFSDYENWQPITIGIQTSDLYIVSVGEKQLTEEQKKYDDCDKNISVNALIDALNKLQKFAYVPNSTPSDEDIKESVKVMAFFLSEAARFELIENACYLVLSNYGFEYQWKDYKDMMNNWHKVSKDYVENRDEDIRQSGDGEEVGIIPLSNSMIRRYNARAQLTMLDIPCEVCSHDGSKLLR